MTAYLVGVDIGSQSVKAGVFDLDGTCLGSSTVALELNRGPDGTLAQDPESFVHGAAATIRESVRAAGVTTFGVLGLAIGGQMAGILGIGADGRAVTPYDSWLDARCSTEVHEITLRLGDELTERTGCPPMVAHAPKQLWWKRHRPADYARIAKFVVPSAYVAGRLCGLAAADAYVDRTHLHFTGLAHAAASEWSSSLAEDLGLDLERQPRIVAPTAVVGSLTAAAAEQCGLRPGTPVAAGTGDTAAGALGAGLVREGQVLDTAGTAAVLALSTQDFRPDLGRMLLSMRGAVPGQWISLAYLAGGDLLRWLPTVLGAPLEQLLQEAASAEPASLLFVPYLGGRILPAAPHARGAWRDLDFRHHRGDLVRAVLESVAFEYAGFLDRALELFPAPTPTSVRVIGGGKDDVVWSRIKAAVLGLPYVRLRRDSFACWGAALVAGAALGLIPDLAAAALDTTVEAERFEPDPALHDIYCRRLADYREATAVTEEVYA